ncbi:hypothetical protein O6H91_14G032100 [Diphasiastrum complanatum]|nr:hypothetical protein O6H91_Y316800 [Diphasiastrum complanatum]KAJ7531096.1 hypothetical protein O6H91_14G032100 [Diphasiastrum complanatum]
MLWNKVRGSSKEDHFSCDRTHWRTDVCHLRGDVRIRNKLIALRSKVQQKRVDDIEKIRPYPRKWESPLMNRIEEVTVKRVYESFPSVNSTEKDCDVNYSAPALVFSTGGYTGHIYHDFNDGLIPLFITIQHLKGEVVFLILEFHDWWMNKYSKIVEQLSHYPVIDLRNDGRTHCFPEMIVGLKIHDDLTVNNTLMPSGESIQDFRQILGKVFDSNNELQPLSEPLDKSIVQKVNGSVVHVKAPKLVLIARKESRAILNQDEVVSVAEQFGFEVQVLVPNGQTELGHIYRVLGSCDAMMGVHGAAMTHFLFMRPGSVFIQVVPIGTTWPSSAFYGEPALRFGLQYIEYKIRPEESSLSKIYNNSDPVLTNPEIIVSKGWEALKETYLQNQNVTLSIPRLKKVLLTSLAKIKGV